VADKSKRKESSMPGRGEPVVGGATGATTRQKLNPPWGRESDPLSETGLFPPPGLNLHVRQLALGAESRGSTGNGVGGIRARGEAGKWERGAVPVDGRSPSAPPAVLLYALAFAVSAIEGALPNIDIDQRRDLAVAACQINHVLRGGCL
jgi:hypothetical protein